MIRRHFFHHISFGRILRYFPIFRVWAQFWAQIWTRNHQKWVHTTQLSLGNTPGAGFEISWFLGCHIISTIQSSSVNTYQICKFILLQNCQLREDLKYTIYLNFFTQDIIILVQLTATTSTSKQASLFDTTKLHLLLPFNLSLFAMHFWREKIIIIPDLSPTSTHTKIMVDYQSRVAFSWIWTFQFIQILRNWEQYNFCVEFSTSVRKKVWFRCCTLKWKV